MGKLQQSITSAGRSVQQAGEWLLEAAKRLFSASDDNYPETGAQPFEGDIPDPRHQH